ncbi:hypothetical protein FA95DRAFT_1520176 [Auriscalpium vulgare]|uniref:Uncharacterized protein n=1 Tax=Auriscalpium vulgare TaxID=40419 RepID=A0ACB8RSF8_9AGAM|nr:hypothetical protein FA95DRAFT_1520176 [Auriscalpium vulgare]
MDAGTDNSGPALKRRREDEGPNSDACGPAASGTTTFRRSGEVWMEDGNIILVSQDVGYRVHRGVLANNSVVFRDMFANSAPSADEVVDGCAVLHLQDVTDDLCHLLKMMYFRKYGRDKRKLGLTALSGLLRLAMKYMLDDLRDELVEYLKFLFPSTLDEYRSHQRSESLPADLDPMLGVRLALELEIPVILPVTLYLSALLPPEKKLLILETDDSMSHRARTEVLLRVMHFERAWADAMHSNRLAGFFKEAPHDVDGLGCDGFRTPQVIWLLKWFSSLRQDVFLTEYNESLWLCNDYDCDSLMDERLEKLPKEIWKDLPSMSSTATQPWSEWGDIPSVGAGEVADLVEAEAAAT